MWGDPSNVPGPKPPFFDAVLVGDLAPWQAVFSVGVPNPMTLVLKQDTPGVDSPIFMELLDLYTEVFAEVQSNFLWGSVRGPSADDLLFGLLGASAQSQGKAQGRPKSTRHFFRDMVKSTKSISAALAGPSESSSNSATARSRCFFIWASEYAIPGPSRMRFMMR